MNAIPPRHDGPLAARDRVSRGHDGDRGRDPGCARPPHARPRHAAGDGPQPRVRGARRGRDPGALDADQVQPAGGAVRADDRQQRRAAAGEGRMSAPVEATPAPAPASDARRNWIALYTVARREVVRILRIWGQTLVPPAITMTLYFLIFGGLIGSRVGEMEGIKYMDFIVPGLVMMSVIQNSYGNISSSFFGAKFGRHVEELLVSPMPSWVILGGYVAGARSEHTSELQSLMRNSYAVFCLKKKKHQDNKQ